MTRKLPMRRLLSIKEKGGKVQAVLSFQINGLFINVNKKYDFDNLSQADIETLIEEN
jgi:rRNA maturation endonuclease Nob1